MPVNFTDTDSPGEGKCHVSFEFSHGKWVVNDYMVDACPQVSLPIKCTVTNLSTIVKAQ